MQWLNPLALAGLAAVALAAAIALFRPGRQVVVVSTLSLWDKAIASLPSGARRRRVFSLSWLLVLVGCALAVLAAARPVVWAERPRRSVAVVVYPSAELANPPGMVNLRRSAERLLDRLDAGDRVQLVLPARLGGASAWLTRDGAAARIRRIQPVLAQGEKLSMAPAPQDAQQVYRVFPASLSLPKTGRTTDLPVPTTTPGITLDAVAGYRLDDATSQVMVAVKNHTAQPRQVELAFDFDSLPGPREMVGLLAGQRKVVVAAVPAGVDRIGVSVGSAIGQKAELTGRQLPEVRLVLIGRDDPMVRKFAEEMPGVALVGSLDQADAVIAVGQDLPAGKPGIALDPPDAPLGWDRAAEPAGPLAMADASTLADAPLMEHVNFGGVWVRGARPFVATASSEGERLVSTPAGVLALAMSRPRRLYIAFSPAGANTNWTLDNSFLILMANATDWVAPGRRQFVWELSDNSAGAVGLAAADGALPGVESAQLPAPISAGRAFELWPWLVAAAGIAWLAGWWRRGHEGGLWGYKAAAPTSAEA